MLQEPGGETAEQVEQVRVVVNLIRIEVNTLHNKGSELSKTRYSSHEYFARFIEPWNAEHTYQDQNCR